MKSPGLTYTAEGVEVSVYSRHAESIQVCLFDGGKETERIRLKREGAFHAALVPGLKPGARYGLRADGPWAPEQGHRFDPSKLLLDPHATRIDHSFAFDDRLSQRGFDTAQLVPKAVAEMPLPDLPLRKVVEPSFIYELQVRSFTKLHPDIPERQCGTVSALRHPSVLAHFKKIGVDTIELMPLTAWISERHLAKQGLTNGWGYNPVSFFAPEPQLAPGGISEVRNATAALHELGFNVILDVVLNHSGEGDASGPTVSFRGLDHIAYYAHDYGRMINDTGCGNTCALNSEPMLSLVISALRHWVLKAGIDGFRFDLATVMGRTQKGFDAHAPLLRAIETDPVLSTRIMIAEPWDLGAGGYQLGHFPPRWLEWNDKFRDDARRFWKGMDFSANAMATRLAGSQDAFGIKAKESKSVNFIAAHDGFTLHDLTIYEHKDNLANGENNQDGKNDEVTCVGADPAALIGTVLLARGVAMITAGDEFGRTQKGNNNAYAQDNETTWLDWTKADSSLIEKTASYAQQRKTARIGCSFLDAARTRWLNSGNKPVDWLNPKNHVLKLEVSGKAEVILDQTRSVAAGGD